MQHSRLLDPIYTFAKLSIFISNEDLRDDMMILIFNSSNVTTQDKTNFVQEKNKATGQASTTERDRLDHLFILANYDLTSRTTREEEAYIMQKIPKMDYYALPTPTLLFLTAWCSHKQQQKNWKFMSICLLSHQMKNKKS